MKSEDLFWKAFEKSGKTGYYLLYKKIGEKNGRKDKGNNNSSDRLS